MGYCKSGATYRVVVSEGIVSEGKVRNPNQKNSKGEKFDNCIIRFLVNEMTFLYLRIFGGYVVSRFAQVLHSIQCIEVVIRTVQKL